MTTHERGDVVRLWSRLVRRRWPVGAVAFVVIAGLGAALLLLSKPVHRAEAALRLGQPPPPGGVSPSAGILSFFQLGGDPFANDMELLGSRSLAESLVERWALAATLDAPIGWHRDSLVTRLATSREVRRGAWRARWRPDGSVEVRSAAGDTLVAEVAPGEPARFAEIDVTFRAWREGMPREIGITLVPFGEAVRRTRTGLRLERPRREANVVALAYQHIDPAVAEGVVAAAVEEFVRLRARIQTRESTETTDSLRVVAARTADELGAAEGALETLQSDARIVAPDAQSEALVERQAELLGRLQRGRAELAGVDEMLRRLDAGGDPGSAWTALLSYPAFLENQTLGELLARLTELHGERDALASRRTETNLDLRVLDERIAYLDRSLRQVAQEYRAGLVEQIATLEPEIARLDGLLASLPAQAIELGRRQRDVRLLTEILILTEQRLRQEELREALTYSNVQVIDPPALRDRPVWPRKKLGLLVVLILAAGTAALAMVVRDRTDGRVRTGTELRALLDAPVLGVVVRSGDGRLSLTPSQARGVLSRIPGERFLIAGAGVPRAADELADALATADPESAHPAPTGAGQGAAGPAPVGGAGPGLVPAAPDHLPRTFAAWNGHPWIAGAVADHAAAAELAVTGVPVAVVVELGRTRARDLRRLRHLLGEARAPLAGVVVVCGSAADEEAVWE